MSVALGVSVGVWVAVGEGVSVSGRPAVAVWSRARRVPSKIEIAVSVIGSVSGVCVGTVICVALGIAAAVCATRVWLFTNVPVKAAAKVCVAWTAAKVCVPMACVVAARSGVIVGVRVSVWDGVAVGVRVGVSVDASVGGGVGEFKAKRVAAMLVAIAFWATTTVWVAFRAASARCVASGVGVRVAVLVWVGVGSGAGAQPTINKKRLSKATRLCQRMAFPFSAGED